MTATPQALYNDIMTYVADAREMTQRGQFIELEKLDKRVKALCDAVQHMRVEEAQAFRPQLDTMMAALHDLQLLFTDKRDALTSELQEMGRHKQAAMAYKHNEASAHRHAPRKEEE